MKSKMKFLIGSIVGIALTTIIVTGVHASSCGIYTQEAHSATWARTTTATHDEGPTYNNYLFAKTLAWSVKDDGSQRYHEGPTAAKYNAKNAVSIVNVPSGKGQWYECQTEGKCNRCGIHAAFEKHMFAF